MIAPSKPNHHKLISLYCARSKLLSIPLILAPIHSTATNNKLNHTAPLAICCSFSFLAMSDTNHPTAIIGRAICKKSNLPNPNSDTISGSDVAPIFDQKIIPKALLNVIIPALTRAIARSVTISPLQLMRRVVIHQTRTARRVEREYCSRNPFSFPHATAYSACSKTVILKISNPTPPSSCHRSKFIS